VRRFLLLLFAPLTLLAPGLGATGVAVGDMVEETTPAPMSIQFPQRHASLVGPRAVVLVECGGVTASACEGTLVLKGLGGAHKVPYVIQRGEQQSLAVPLGDEVDHGCRARVVARTLQLTGGTVRTSSVLRVG
jgi:hypothetical protein